MYSKIMGCRHLGLLTVLSQGISKQNQLLKEDQDVGSRMTVESDYRYRAGHSRFSVPGLLLEGMVTRAISPTFS